VAPDVGMTVVVYEQFFLCSLDYEWLDRTALYSFVSIGISVGLEEIPTFGDNGDARLCLPSRRRCHSLDFSSPPLPPGETLAGQIGDDGTKVLLAS
jgi:hypothetical protein